MEMSRQRLRPSLAETSLHHLPALRRHRPCAQHRECGAARAARHRGRGRQAPRRRDRRALPPDDRALSAQPEARAADRHRGALFHARDLYPRRGPDRDQFPHREAEGADRFAPRPGARANAGAGAPPCPRARGDRGRGSRGRRDGRDRDRRGRRRDRRAQRRQAPPPPPGQAPRRDRRAGRQR